MPNAMSLREGDLDTVEMRGKYTVTVLGCGRMGLPMACLFAEACFKVICLDTNQHIVNQIKKGVSPFIEPGLDKLIKKNVKEGRLAATSDAKESISNSDIIVVAVNTPINGKKKPDYSYLEAACREIGLNLKSGTLLIFESTVGPGLMESLVKETLEASSGLKAGNDFGLAFSPIRATVGRVLQDITNYPKILAAIDNRSLAAARTVLKTIVKGGVVEVSNMKTAEAVKLFENIYRDVNLALANELASFCEKAGIDYIEAQEAANSQPYCRLLKPGIVSGHIPKDPFLLVEEAENLRVKLHMTILARRINDETVKRASGLIKEALHTCGKTVKRSKVSILGVSYRPDVKETKGSLVIELVKLLQEKGIEVNVFDPYYTCDELKSLGYPAERTFTKTIEGTDCLVIAVGHERFKRLSLGKIKVLMRKPPSIVDLAHVVNPVKVEREGFIYRGLGRGIWSK
ncbi:MAG: nucleotide sugar dehydrogenase [Candidatus Bathyarchaeia archaeon]